MMARRTGLILGAIFLTMAAAGCSTFERDFDAARAKGGPDTVEGAWEGRWQSQNGHGGDRLRAVVTRTAPDTLHARFRSQFWGLFAAEDAVDLKVTGTSPIRAAGDADLGFLKGGVYQYDATLTATTFGATYKSKYDHGEFKLTR
jgi:hypothetical protein